MKKSTSLPALQRSSKLMGLALLSILTIGIAVPAHADRDDHGRGHDDHWHGRHYVHARPGGYIYAPPPPPVAYYPPQPVYGGSPGINLVLPVHF